MKQLTVSDKDYETLMGLSKELQVQENDGQAFPYFWSPGSMKYGIGWAIMLHKEATRTI